MSSIREIHLLFLYCEDCDQAYRGFESDPCPVCNQTLRSIKFEPHHVQQLLEYVWQHTSGAISKEELLESLTQFIWFAHDKETLQACWFTLQSNGASDELLNFFEEEFTQAPTFKEIEMTEAIALDMWEREQENQMW
jgi:hypothetical protein